jgi:beta-glucosidase
MILKRFSSFTLFFSLSVAFLSSAEAQSSPFSAEAKQNAEALLKRMTLDEKIGQLNQSAGIVMPGIAEKKPVAPLGSVVDRAVAREFGISRDTLYRYVPVKKRRAGKLTK